jgi:hypothetical protein
MRRACWVLFLALTMVSSRSWGRELDAGLAITDPKLLKLLDRTYGIGQMIPTSSTVAISNKDLFALPVMRPVLTAITQDIREKQSNASDAGSPFNIKYLTTGYARLVLSGIVNRMDRAWSYIERDPTSCGQLRFIYRLVYHVELTKLPGKFVDSYLPMTFNLVLRTHDPGDNLTCADLAKRWLRMADTPVMPKDLVDRSTGLLVYADQAHVDRLEMNMQSVRWGASSIGKKDFGGRADYILRVFKFDGTTALFAPQVMENEIDRDKLLASENAPLLLSLKSFLLDPANIAALDKGILKIPDAYLTTRGLSVAPGGAVSSANRILSDLLNAGDPDIVASVDKAVARGNFATIRSALGFERRLDDISCSGCHQTHSAAGFHFMGIDWNQIHPNNTTQIAGSPHFFGDMPRRREIVTAIANGRTVDYTRGFAARPLPCQQQAEIALKLAV